MFKNGAVKFLFWHYTDLQFVNIIQVIFNCRVVPQFGGLGIEFPATQSFFH